MLATNVSVALPLPALVRDGDCFSPSIFGINRNYLCYTHYMVFANNRALSDVEGAPVSHATRILENYQ